MCVAPNLIVPVQRLATPVAKLSAEADRRLLRLYQFVKFAADWVFTGSPSVRDFDHLVAVSGQMRAFAVMCGLQDLPVDFP